MANGRLGFGSGQKMDQVFNYQFNEIVKTHYPTNERRQMRVLNSHKRVKLFGLSLGTYD